MTQQQNTWEALEKSKTSRSARSPQSSESRPQKPERVPLWIVIMFIFALAFCLFAVYKAFIYKQGYSDTQVMPDIIDVNFEQESSGEVNTGNEAITVTWVDGETQNSSWAALLQEKNNPSLILSRNQNWNQNQTSGTVSSKMDRSGDTALIEAFYKHLVANDLDKMNVMVHGSLLKSKAWRDHWNAKNLGIFSRNLVGNLNLDNLFFVANSTNEAKKSRQYSYTLSYTVQPDHQYKEDRKITLITQGTGKVLISEIMCETKGCSRSPFFWPQNLNLK